ncbi:hypothetical protein CAEBREN_21633 [Caenorhabditis brenneri]|uniref:non-specific serine/threonine protein kinase n=1 Tax=Caenorhabditis brenneri TaxID=135651 RepID=G0NJW7_CAEBE|nr:hypothetical protein CAEBREN_21633 [Caenorhabditis brenneri]
MLSEGICNTTNIPDQGNMTPVETVSEENAEKSTNSRKRAPNAPSASGSPSFSEPDKKSKKKIELIVTPPITPPDLNSGYCPVENGQVLRKRYQVQKMLGSGAYATVYLAKDKKIKRTVALKFVRTGELFNNASDIEIECMEKAKKASKSIAFSEPPIGSNNIVTLLGKFHLKSSIGTHYVLVMESLVSDLFSVLWYSNQKRLTLHRIKRFMKDVVEGLFFLHTVCNIMHLDIKPENLSVNKIVARMKPLTSKVSVAPISEEPLTKYVNYNLPNPDDEPYVSDMHNYQAGEELHCQQSQLAKERYTIALPEMIDANRGVFAELFTRFTEDDKRKKAEMQKNKEAMAASAPPLFRHSGDSRKRRNDVMVESAEEEWKRQPHQQQWMVQSQMQQYPHHVQQQQYMQMQMAAQQQQHQGIQMHHNNQMPSTTTADSARSVHTPASIYQQSPMEGRNGNRMAPSGSGMNTDSPTSGSDQQTDENTLAFPEGDWFEKLKVTVAEPDDVNVAQQLPPPIQQLPTPQPQQHHHQQQMMRMMQQQEMQRMEHQRHQQLLQAQLAQQRHQQQQMILQQQPQHRMNGGFQSHAQQQAAYMQAQRMHQMRMQQHHHQQQQQQHQNGGMGYGMPNGYPPK